MRNFRPRGRLQLKMAMTYIAIIVAMLVILDVYPTLVSRNFIFRSKQETLEERAELFSTTLSGFGEVTGDAAGRVYEAIDFGDSDMRVVVTDAALHSVFDNSVSENSIGKIVFLTELRTAIEGNDVFYSVYENGAIISRAAMPVMIGGQTAGAVYLYEIDDELGGLLGDMNTNLMRISAIVLVGVLVISLLLSRVFAIRVENLLKAIRQMREGKYGTHVEMNGNDELSELADEFNSMSDRLKQSEEMRRRFVSDASHELKTPLAAVRILVDSILGSDMPPELIREFIEGIGEETDRLSRLTESLLSVTRLESRKAVTGVVDVGKVVSRVQRNLTPLSESAEVSVNSSLDENCFISANSDDIYQIVFNLVENAIKYNRTGGSVRIYLYKREERVMLIVSDTGVGIPQEDIERIFERFYRVDKARSREAGGSGLGLSIVKHAVEQFSGEISVESTLGEGTRITVSFPLCEEGGAEQ